MLQITMTQLFMLWFQRRAPAKTSRPHCSTSPHGGVRFPKRPRCAGALCHTDGNPWDSQHRRSARGSSRGATSVWHEVGWTGRVGPRHAACNWSTVQYCSDSQAVQPRIHCSRAWIPDRDAEAVAVLGTVQSITRHSINCSSLAVRFSIS